VDKLIVTLKVKLLISALMIAFIVAMMWTWPDQ
jgi:hypothetical protein